ncbi:MAG: hypothetical protein HUU54_11075 [Ignavibacteriaceae bacterium]|nr:hypothetical protein [Ignavibacteriaceae bacterium]
MSREYRILIAEDTIAARDVIIDELNKITDFKIVFSECDSAIGAFQTLDKLHAKGQHLDFLFVDIDFKEDNKGGKRDSGFEIIEKAFEHCPISTIATYSAQYNTADLSPRHIELQNRGMIVDVFDKRQQSNPEEWFRNRFIKHLESIGANDYLWDVWYNHKLIKSFVDRTRLSPDEEEDSIKKAEIKQNLEAIIVLLKKRKLFNADEVVFRLIIQLYHRCLEVYCAEDKDPATIKQQSEDNKEAAERLLGRYFERGLGSDDSALRKLIAFNSEEKLRHGYRLNSLRNNSVHPNLDFNLTMANILFANLTLTLYASPFKKDIQIDKIEQFGIGSKDLGMNYLTDVIRFVRK